MFVEKPKDYQKTRILHRFLVETLNINDESLSSISPFLSPGPSHILSFLPGKLDQYDRDLGIYYSRAELTNLNLFSHTLLLTHKHTHTIYNTQTPLLTHKHTPFLKHIHILSNTYNTF